MKTMMNNDERKVTINGLLSFSSQTSQTSQTSQFNRRNNEEETHFSPFLTISELSKIQNLKEETKMPAKAFFLMRLNDHIQYLKEIEATLLGDGNFQGSSHRDCKLGKWLYGDGSAEIATLNNNKVKELFDSLFEPHERFHNISKQALEKKQGGDDQGAQTAITEMHVLSHVIAQKLLELDALA